MMTSRTFCFLAGAYAEQAARSLRSCAPLRGVAPHDVARCEKLASATASYAVSAACILGDDGPSEPIYKYMNLAQRCAHLAARSAVRAKRRGRRGPIDADRIRRRIAEIEGDARMARDFPVILLDEQLQLALIQVEGRAAADALRFALGELDGCAGSFPTGGPHPKKSGKTPPGRGDSG